MQPLEPVQQKPGRSSCANRVEKCLYTGIHRVGAAHFCPRKAIHGNRLISNLFVAISSFIRTPDRL